MTNDTEPDHSIVAVPPTDIAVVIGRFQTDELTAGHARLLEFPSNQGCERLIVFVGVTNIAPTKNDPLDFMSRDQMLRDWIESTGSLHGIDVTIVPLPDRKNDSDWARYIDDTISSYAGHNAAGRRVTIFGSRDSALNTYKRAGGKFQSYEIPEVPNVSATSVRRSIGRSAPLNCRDFRSGIIYATQLQFPVSYSTVDIAVYAPRFGSDGAFIGFNVALGTKNDGQGLRFPGGFVDPSLDTSLELAAAREMYEEMGIGVNVGKAQYICSMRLNDWRYRNQVDKILTTLFAFEYSWGTIKAGDDLETLEWIQINVSNVGWWSTSKTAIGENHRELMAELATYLVKKFGQANATVDYDQPTNKFAEGLQKPVDEIAPGHAEKASGGECDDKW